MQLFFGLPIGPEASAELWRVSLQMRDELPALWSPRENYHLTLAYLGERPESDLPLLHELLERAIREQPPFTLTLDGLGFFSKGIVHGRVENSDALFALAQALRRQLDNAGIAYQPPLFVPHITLARKAAYLPDCSVGKLSFAVNRVLLYHSVRTEEGRQYLPVDNQLLGGTSL